MKKRERPKPKIVYRQSNTPKEEHERRLAKVFDYIFELTLQRFPEERRKFMRD